jgi:hypothetical protein
LLILFS